MVVSLFLYKYWPMLGIEEISADKPINGTVTDIPAELVTLNRNAWLEYKRTEDAIFSFLKKREMDNLPTFNREEK